MKIKCLIVDDEPVARKILREFTARLSFLELAGEAEDTTSASVILGEQNIDLLFLDIQMPKITGIGFLKSRKKYLPLTIITTAYPEHAVEGFELDILDYLVKPISFERFSKACSKAQQYRQLLSQSSKSNDFFFVKCNNRIEKVDYEELICAEAIGNYIVLHTTTGQRITYLTLKGLQDHLPRDKFTKVHKSFVINNSKIKHIVGNEIMLGEKTVPISQSMRGKVMQIILGDKIVKR